MQENTISQSLGITLTDVDFGLEKDIPYWRKDTQQKQSTAETRRHSARVKSDVPVVLNSFANVGLDTSFNALDIGSDTISETHRALLLKLKKGPTPFIATKTQAAPLFLDRLLTPDISNSLDRPKALALKVKWESGKTKSSKINKDINKEIHIGNKNIVSNNIQKHSDSRKRVSSTMKTKAKTTDSVTRHKALKSMFGSGVDVNTLANVLSDISDQIVSKQDITTTRGKPSTKDQQSVKNNKIDNEIFQTGLCFRLTRFCDLIYIINLHFIQRGI